MNADLSLPTSATLERNDAPVAEFPWLRAGPLLALWLMPCWGLAMHWKLNPQYQYGWFVPFLALYAGYQRWRTRPYPGAPWHGGLTLSLVLLILVLPMWLFGQPNPDWQTFNWLFVAQVAAINLGVIGALGGWVWVRHFCVPIALMFTAVPWPDVLEAPVMQGLMHSAASCAVAVLDVLGVAAIQKGNLIEVSTGVVGVDEACSGIRSLQGAMMASLVLGEFFRFNAARRWLLFGISIAVAFLTNVVRVCFLAWNAAQSGLGAVDRWHDPAGLTGLAVCIVTVMGVARWLDRDSTVLRIRARIPAATPLPRWFTPALAVWLVLVVVAVELWFYDGAKPPEGPWSFRPPAVSEVQPISPSAQNYLRYDEVTSAKWVSGEGFHWLVWFFDWKVGPAFSRVAAQMHRPDICLPASGSELVLDRGRLEFPVAGVSVPFHGYVFRQNGRLFHVYHGVWQFRTERGQSHGALAQQKHLASLQSVLWRDRYLGQQAAEIIIWGSTSEARADAALRARLPELLRPRSDAGLN